MTQKIGPSCLKHNKLNVEQLSRCSVRISHNGKCFDCRFFVVPGHGPALFWMPDIEFPSIIRFMCETIDNKTNDMKFEVHIQACSRQPQLQYKEGPTGKARCR